MKRTLASLSAILLALVAPAAASAQQLVVPSEGAEARLIEDPLYRGDLFYYRGDYYRAITQYELYLMSNPPRDRADAVRLKIAWLYARGDKLAAAAGMLRDVIAARPSYDRMAVWGRLYYADVALQASKGRAAERAYTNLLEQCGELVAEGAEAGYAEAVGAGECLYIESYARLGLARRQARAHDFEGAVAQLRAMPEGSPLAPKTEEIAARIEGVELPRKSPGLAGALSIVPGLGHFYIEQWGPGVVAMLWNGAFIYAFVDSLVGRKYGQATLIGVIEMIWYSGTIFGAVAGAHRFNRDARRIIEGGLQQDIDQLGDAQPWPARFPVERAPLQLNWEWSF